MGQLYRIFFSFLYVKKYDRLLTRGYCYDMFSLNFVQNSWTYEEYLLDCFVHVQVYCIVESICQHMICQVTPLDQYL